MSQHTPPNYWLWAGLGALVIFGGGQVAKAISNARGIRNNNPGNLVKTADAWKGKVAHAQNTDGRFEQFIAPEWGIRAMFIDVRGDITKRGQNTVKKLITSYAPAFENNTAAYIAVVAKAIGKSADALITDSDYLPLMKAIIKHENGSNPYPDALIIKGMNLA